MHGTCRRPVRNVSESAKQRDFESWRIAGERFPRAVSTHAARGAEFNGGRSLTPNDPFCELRRVGEDRDLNRDRYRRIKVYDRACVPSFGRACDIRIAKPVRIARESRR